MNYVKTLYIVVIGPTKYFDQHRPNPAQENMSSGEGTTLVLSPAINPVPIVTPLKLIVIHQIFRALH